MNFDRTLFAANIVAVVSADGVLNPLELSQCETVKKHFKYTKSEWAKGEKLAATPGFVPKPTGTFADKVTNLESMLRIAYADGEAARPELDLINRFCNQIGITQQQLDSLNADVVNDVQRDPVVCPSCGAELPHGSAFCSSCGAKIAADAGVKTAFDIPKEGLAITFCESTAASFPDALKLAQETYGFQEIERTKKKWYLAAFTWEDTRWRKMVELVAGMRNKEVFEKGEKKDWYEVFSWKMMNCLRGRDSAYDESAYCFRASCGYVTCESSELNPWGCASLQLAWNAYTNSWMKFGSWQNLEDGLRWVFDKDRIRHAYAENARDVRKCPYFTDTCEKVLAALPDYVYPVRDRAWKFRQVCDETTPGAIKVKIQDEWGVNTIWTDGPEPADLSVFEKIVRAVYPDKEFDRIVRPSGGSGAVIDGAGSPIDASTAEERERNDRDLAEAIRRYGRDKLMRDLSDFYDGKA